MCATQAPALAPVTCQVRRHGRGVCFKSPGLEQRLRFARARLIAAWGGGGPLNTMSGESAELLRHTLDSRRSSTPASWKEAGRHARGRWQQIPSPCDTSEARGPLAIFGMLCTCICGECMLLRATLLQVRSQAVATGRAPQKVPLGAWSGGSSSPGRHAMTSASFLLPGSGTNNQLSTNPASRCQFHTKPAQHMHRSCGKGA